VNQLVRIRRAASADGSLTMITVSTDLEGLGDAHRTAATLSGATS
jgi:hypothetical protein